MFFTYVDGELFIYCLGTVSGVPLNIFWSVALKNAGSSSYCMVQSVIGAPATPQLQRFGYVPSASSVTYPPPRPSREYYLLWICTSVVYQPIPRRNNIFHFPVSWITIYFFFKRLPKSNRPTIVHRAVPKTIRKPCLSFRRILIANYTMRSTVNINNKRN